MSRSLKLVYDKKIPQAWEINKKHLCIYVDKNTDTLMCVTKKTENETILWANSSTSQEEQQLIQSIKEKLSGKKSNLSDNEKVIISQIAFEKGYIISNEIQLSKKASGKLINAIMSLLNTYTPLLEEQLKKQAKNLYIKKFHQHSYKLCKFIYVIVDNEITFAPESFFRPEGEFPVGEEKYTYRRPTHSMLAKGKAVQAAGECIFVKDKDNKWSLRFLTNGSGHYRPDAFKTLPFAKKIFQKKLSTITNLDSSQIVLRNSLTPHVTLFDEPFLLGHADLQSSRITNTTTITSTNTSQNRDAQSHSDSPLLSSSRNSSSNPSSNVASLPNSNAQPDSRLLNASTVNQSLPNNNESVTSTNILQHTNTQSNQLLPSLSPDLLSDSLSNLTSSDLNVGAQPDPLLTNSSLEPAQEQSQFLSPAVMFPSPRGSLKDSIPKIEEKVKKSGDSENTAEDSDQNKDDSISRSCCMNNFC